MNSIANWFDLAVAGGDHFSFWSSGLGLTISFVIMVCSFANILHPGVDDNLIDRAYYSVMAILFLLAFMVGLTNEPPHSLTKFMLIALAVRFPLSLLMRHQRWIKTGQPQPTCSPSKKARGKR